MQIQKWQNLGNFTLHRTVQRARLRDIYAKNVPLCINPMLSRQCAGVSLCDSVTCSSQEAEIIFKKCLIFSAILESGVLMFVERSETRCTADPSDRCVDVCRKV